MPRPVTLFTGQRADLPFEEVVRLASSGATDGRPGSDLPWARPQCGWDLVSTGHGDVPWEDAGTDRLLGAPDAPACVRSKLFDAPAAAFDAAFASGN
jgi:hypothetical protein